MNIKMPVRFLVYEFKLIWKGLYCSLYHKKASIELRFGSVVFFTLCVTFSVFEAESGGILDFLEGDLGLVSEATPEKN